MLLRYTFGFILCFFLLPSCEPATQINTGETIPNSTARSVQNGSATPSGSFVQDSLETQSLEGGGCSKYRTIIIPCGHGDGGNSPPGVYTLKLITPNFSFSVEDESSESDAIFQLDTKLHHFFGGIMTETESALLDLDISQVLADIPVGLGGGHEDHFSFPAEFSVDRKARLITSVNNSKLNVELNLFDTEADLILQSDQWNTSDADINASVDQINISDRFNIATAQFENFQVDFSGFGFNIDRGFPLGDIESISDGIDFILALLGKDDVDNLVRNGIKDEIENFYIGNVNPNAFIAEQLDLLANYNLGPIDGIPADQLLPILADLLRDFEASAELYVKQPANLAEGGATKGLVQLTLSGNAMSQAKNAYYAQN